MRTEVRWLAAAMALCGALAPAAAREPTVAYSNPKWGFCLRYPADWRPVAGESDNVLTLAPANAVPGTIHGSIQAAGYRDRRGHGANQIAEARGPEATLEDALEDLRDQMVRDLRVSSRKETRWGLPALVSDVAFEHEGMRWRSQQVRVMRADEVVLELILSAPEEQYRAARPVFARIAGSFQPSCAAAGADTRP